MGRRKLSKNIHTLFNRGPMTPGLYRFGKPNPVFFSVRGPTDFPRAAPPWHHPVFPVVFPF